MPGSGYNNQEADSHETWCKLTSIKNWVIDIKLEKKSGKKHDLLNLLRNWYILVKYKSLKTVKMDIFNKFHNATAMKHTSVDRLLNADSKYIIVVKITL